MNQPPEDVRELDRILSAVRFEPRASLEPEVVGRVARDKVPERRRDWLRVALGISAVVAVAVGLERRAGQRESTDGLRSIDRCCEDYDGNGLRDDGLLVLAGREEDIRRLSIYQDRDGSGGFSPADSIRFTREGQLTIEGPLGPGVATSEFCCVDYDGGGYNDDALVIVTSPPDHIAMAAIYERRSGTRALPLR